MSGKIKSITDPRLCLTVLTDKDIGLIHQATLEVIETVGVRFPSSRALQIWEAHGALVDWGSTVVKAPGKLIEDALSNAPPTYALAARESSQDLLLDGNHVFVGTDGCGIEIIDLNTNRRRTSCLQDVADIARVGDYLDQVAFHWVAVSAQDCPPETRGLYELLAIWENSTKHAQTESIYSEREARAAVEMARAMAGGADELRRRPLLSMMQCTTSPLGHDAGCLDAALIGAAAGLPVGFMTMASCLTTGPATLAGTLVVGNAEVISALALVQLAYPGAAVFYAAAQTASDPRTGAYTGGGPADFLFGAATNQLSDYYDVPLSMGSFATGAKEPDWQAGIENSLSTLMAAASMSDMLLGVGLLHGSRIWSFEQMLLDCEIFDIVHRMMQGIIVDKGTLALDVIQEVGPGGNYLGHVHTRDNVRSIWVPQYMDRRPFGTWETKGDRARDWARDRAKHILSEHHPDPLEPALAAELRGIIKSTDALG